MGLKLPGSSCEYSDDFLGSYLTTPSGTAIYSAYNLGWMRYPVVGTPSTNYAQDIASTAANPGVSCVQMDYTASGRSSMYLTDVVNGNCVNFRGIWYVKIESLSGASGSSTEWNFKCGLMNLAAWSAAPGNPTDGIFFETTANNALWYFTSVRSTSVSGNTKTSTTIVPSTSWVKLEIRSDAAGTTWYAYVNDVLKVTQTTKIPANTIYLTPGFKIENGASTSSGTPRLNIDYFYMNIPNLAR